MKIIWQGKEIETEKTTVSDFLAAKGVDPARCVVEWNGAVFAPGDDVSNLVLAEGRELSVFKIVAGG